MPRGRILLKSISQSVKLAKLQTDSARLLYTWTLSHLDINGCFYGEADTLKNLVFTKLKKTEKQVEEWLEDLEINKLIIRFQNNGEHYLFFPDFVDKQPNLRADHEGKPYINDFNPTKLQPNSNPIPTFDGTSKVKESKVKSNIRANSNQTTTKKSSYGEFVSLTEDEHQKLIDKFGKETTNKMIDILDNAKGAKGYKYKSDYRAILSWVVDKVEKEKTTQSQGTRIKCKECGDDSQHVSIGEDNLCALCRGKEYDGNI